VVGWPIITNESGTVKAKHHVEILKGYIMYYLIECPLHEAGVNVAERYKAVGSHAGSKCNSVLLGYAHIKCSFWHFLHHNVHGASGGHSRSNSNYSVVTLGEFNQGFTKNILIPWRGWLAGKEADSLTGVLVEFSGSVEDCLVLLGRSIAFSFNGYAVQEFRTRNILQIV